jgi:hypothetical protein
MTRDWDEKAPISMDWLTNPTTVEVQESEHTHDGVVFGHCNGQWLDLLAQMRPTDALWEFDSGANSWGYRHGRSGVALVRDGGVVD